METGGLELIRIAHVTGYEIRDPAPTIRYKIIPVDHDYLGIWLKSFETAGRLWAQGHGTDDDNILWHRETPFYPFQLKAVLGNFLRFKYQKLAYDYWYYPLITTYRSEVQGLSIFLSSTHGSSMLSLSASVFANKLMLYVARTFWGKESILWMIRCLRPFSKG